MLLRNAQSISSEIAAKAVWDMISHSQTMHTCQPRVRSASSDFRSLSTFRASLGSQYSEFDAGVCDRLHP
jgi:hypothetical protein